jgi:hypothetical protein
MVWHDDAACGIRAMRFGIEQTMVHIAPLVNVKPHNS